MNGIESGTGGLSLKKYKTRKPTSTAPSGTSICLLARGKRSGERLRSHQTTPTSGRQPANIDSRKTTSPIDPTKIGTTLAEKHSMQRPSRVNLKDSPSDLKRADSLAHSRNTRNARKANETSSEELLKKKIV